MSTQWIPSNGTEGHMFIESWCGNCVRDALCNGTKSDKDDFDDGELCPILAASFRGEAKEWIEHDDGRCECTAFVEFGRPVPAVDDMTMDLFVGGSE